MATWSLLLFHSPLTTAPGTTGLIGPIKLATGISMKYAVEDIDTLSFSVPGRHYQTGLIREGLTDVIAMRDEEVMQRFRVVSTVLSGQGTDVTVNVTCSAYKEVVNAWIIQDPELIGVATLPSIGDTEVTITPNPGLVVGDVVIFGFLPPTEGVFNYSGQTMFVISVVSPGVYEFASSPKSIPPNVVDGGTTNVYRPVDRLDFFAVDLGIATGNSTTNVFTFTYPHGLTVGDEVWSYFTPAEHGVAEAGVYAAYTLTVPSSTTATFSFTPGGTPIDILNTGGTSFWQYTEENDPSHIAWMILDEGQSKSFGDIGCTQGLTPVDPLPRRSFYAETQGDSSNAAAHYLAPGQTRSEAINQFAQLDQSGFEWSIDPDPDDPYTALKFNTWNRGARFTATDGLASFVLSEATMATWSIKRDMADYANVVRATPKADTVGGSTGGFNEAVWRPADFTPDNTTADPEAQDKGRWEVSLDSAQFTPELVGTYADEQLTFHQDRFVGLEASIVPGRWTGPDQFWLGDSLRIVLWVPLVNDDNEPTGDYLVSLDDVVRVVGITIGVGSDGSEDVGLELNRGAKTLLDAIYELQTDVKTLKRR